MPQAKSPASSQRPHRAHHQSGVTVWRWRIASAREPLPLTWALPLGNAVLDALSRTCWTLSGSGRLPTCLHGPSAPQDAGWNHGHAFVLPEDSAGDGWIDHIVIVATAGLDPAAIRLLASTDRVRLSNGLTLELMLAQAGGLDVMPASWRGPSRNWISRTPYIPDGGGRARFDRRDAARQLKHSIGKRKPDAQHATAPEWQGELSFGQARVTAGEFHLEQDTGAVPPPGAEPGFYRLSFAEPVLAPLAFGWGAHRGLGLFVAAD